MPGYRRIHRVVVSIVILTFLFLVLPLGAQTWTQLATTGGPPAPRAWASAVLDPATSKMILFSGGTSGGSTDVNDVWSLATSGSPIWTQLSPAGTLPNPRVGQTGVYDSVNSRIMMFGGGLGETQPCSNDVWVLSNANSVNGTPTWTQLNPTGGPPVPRVFHSAVYSPATNGMIVFGGNNCVPIGGSYYNDVWVLSNANGLGGTPVWTQLSVSGGPSVRQGAAVAYDPDSNRMIVFGGFGQQVPYNDVWVLSNANGTGGAPAWTQLSPGGAAIPPRDFASAAYDVTSDRMTIFGGLNVGSLLGDAWTLSFANGLGGTPTWTQLAATLPAREAQTTVYDAAGNRMIIFGGFLTSGYVSDTWALSNANGLAPSVPTLSVVSAHTGNFTQGQTGVYTLTVSNQAGAPATSGLVNVTDTLPGGLTLSSMGPDSGWTCGGSTCVRSDALNGGASYPPITVIVNVGVAATSPQVNSVSASGGGSATAVDTDSTVIQAAAGTGPAPLSVTPSSGSGAQQTFALVYADPLGATDLSTVWVWITSNFNTVSSANSCLAYYARAANQLFLLNDAGTAYSSATPGAAVTLSNSQCSINVAAASVPAVGMDLTVNLPVTFMAAYAGAKSTWMFAAGLSANSGWQAMGTWTVPPGTEPEPVSVAPSSGTGMQQTFALQYNDPLGATDLTNVWVWFTSGFNTLSSNSSCLAYYSRAANQLFLLNDASTAYTSATPGAAVTLSNSQCSINMATMSATPSGTNLTLNLPVTFEVYAGAKGIYLYAAGSTANSGWQEEGTWIVPGTVATVTTVSVTPTGGSGASQTFTLQYSDTLGAADLSAAWVWFTSNFNTVSSANSCIGYYARATNQILLINDAGTAYSSATPGTAVTLTNSNCSINAATTTVVPSGNNLTVNLPVTFAAGFAGAKTIFMFALGSTANSGWQNMGTWTVPLSTSPAPVSVTPVSGSALIQTFALLYADPLGFTDLTNVWVWFTSTFNTVSSANSCIAYYVRATNQVNLINDAGTALLPSATPGAAVTLSNSQCSLNMATTTIVTSGNNLTVNLPVTFAAGYAGAKGAFMYASGLSANSGWQSMGTWTVP